MAAVTTEDGRREEVQDGESIKDACEKLGVPFGCSEGICGACEIEVVEGFENLSDKTQNEEDMGLEENRRLACQCKIKQGEIKIRF
ncbi:(2Fe-2S)-binding protein [Candidatus Woesearchaeota archaeon]|nr:MAG: (2Fe-2S)-binding protein [Candidatus Woesearchaeota archaeon]